MPFDAEAFRKDFLEACDVADGVKAPLDVRAKVIQYGSKQYLRGACPRCRTVAALWNEGRHLCRRCGAWLKYRREA